MAARSAQLSRGMSAELQEISPEAYAKQILPLTAKLWANGRTFDAYVSQTLELARTPYGKRHYRTLGLSLDGKFVASFKRYHRIARLNGQRLPAFGIGAVFTPAEERRRGYASAMLGIALDWARRHRFDLAYLFSDIHPQFYKPLGFEELPSRIISIRSDKLPKTRVSAEPLNARAWSAIQRCFEESEPRRSWGIERGPLFWKWLQTRIAHGSEHAQGQPVHLVVRRGRAVAAYVFGQREPAHDAYVVDEFGLASESDKELVGALLRTAAGDLRKITGWLPPEGARDALPQGTLRKRKDTILMIAPLTKRGSAFVERAKNSAGDAVWSTDHI